MAADASLTLELEAKQIYDEMTQVQSRFAALASKIAKDGEDSGKGHGHGFVEGLRNALKGVGGVFQSIGHAVTSTAGILGIGIGLSATVAGIRHFIEQGAHLEDLSRKFGISAETFTKWSFAAQKAGVDADQVGKAIGFIEKTREKAVQGGEGSEVAQSYARLGITFEELKNPLIATDDLLNKLTKSNLNAADSTKVMGKAGLDFRTVLAQVGDGVITVNKGLTALELRKLKEVQDAFVDLGQKIQIALGPIVIAAFRSLEDHLDIFVTHVREAVIQLTALHDAAKTKTPTAFFDALKKGKQDTEAEERGLAERQTERKRRNEEEDAKGVAPISERLSTIAKESIDAGEAKDDKKEAKQDAKEVREEKKEIRDESKDAREETTDKFKERQQERQREKLDRNPANLSLKDYATEGSGRVAALAQEATREEAAAKQNQLRGDFTHAAQHQDRAEQIKKSLGLPSKLDQKEAFKDGLDESKTLKEIRDNTKKAIGNL